MSVVFPISETNDLVSVMLHNKHALHQYNMQHFTFTTKVHVMSS